MRRWVSLLLVLFFGLWPLTGALEASDDSRLPSCCRRHGAHHCAMSMRMVEAVSGSTPMLTAPPTCPLFPGALSGTSAPTHALAVTAVRPPASVVQARCLAANREGARMMPIRTHAGRGPPVLFLS